MIRPYMTLKVGTLQAKRRRQWSRVVGRRRSHWSKSQDEEEESPTVQIYTHSSTWICPWNETLNSQRRFRRRSPPKEGAPPPFYCSILWWLPLIFGSRLTFLHDSSNHHLPLAYLLPLLLLLFKKKKKSWWPLWWQLPMECRFWYFLSRFKL